MPPPTPPDKVALIQALGAADHSFAAIAQAVGVSYLTVRRYLGAAECTARRHDSHKPLYDPRRVDMPEQSLTAVICGDPVPGRRELVAANRANEPDRQFQVGAAPVPDGHGWLDRGERGHRKPTP